LSIFKHARGVYGHGKIECSDPEAIKILGNYYMDKISKNKKCKIGGCKYKDRHTTEGRVCHYCDKLAIKNHNQKCLKSGAKILDEKQFNQVINNNNIQIGYYIIISIGMDNYWYIRNNKGFIEYFFMNFECWDNMEKKPLMYLD